MNGLVALTNFETIDPANLMTQAESLDVIAGAHSHSKRILALIKRYGVKKTKISHRGFESLRLGANGADANERALFFARRSGAVLDEFYPFKKPQPDHIIHVTCTGYVSPSAVQRLVSLREWETDITHAYHMGCYASFPAVRIAEGYLAARNANVDIVHTEMCGLHLNTQDDSPEQLVVQSLFGDGHIKYSVQPQSEVKIGFAVVSIKERIVKDSHEDMSWTPASWGMKMTLSRHVPEKIGLALRTFLNDLIKDSPYELDEILKEAHFAVHPGGPKIIDSVQEILELSDWQLSASRKVLYDHGNMSSATLPFVWKQMLEDKISPGQIVVSFAFGPGLTIFGGLFKVL